MSQQELEDRRLVLLLMGTTPSGEDDWRLIHGVVRVMPEQVVLERPEGAAPFVLEPEWLPRIRPVTPEQARVLGPAELVLPLAFGPIPEGTSTSELRFTGLRLQNP